MSDNTGICLRCRFYDDKPPFGGDLPDTYGRCNWEPDLSKLPAVDLLGYNLKYANAEHHTRMIPKRALQERGDLWAKCDAFDAAVSSQRNMREIDMIETSNELREVAAIWDASARYCDDGYPDLAKRDRRIAAAIRRAADILDSVPAPAGSPGKP